MPETPIVKLSEVEKPVIGQTYLVPGVKIKEGRSWVQAGLIVPVIGGLHEDREIIGLGAYHWHPDFRFMPDEWMEERMSDSRGPFRGELQRNFFRFVVIESNAEQEGLYQMKCFRHHPTFPYVAPWRTKLETAYAGAVAKCGLCPHRGISLEGAPRRGGKLVCPGHGLAFDPETMECQPRNFDRREPNSVAC